MPTYTFTVELQGTGDTQEEAWLDAVDSFAMDPGDPGEVTELDDDDELYSGTPGYGAKFSTDDETDSVE